MTGLLVIFSLHFSPTYTTVAPKFVYTQVNLLVTEQLQLMKFYTQQ